MYGAHHYEQFTGRLVIWVQPISKWLFQDLSLCALTKAICWLVVAADVPHPPTNRLATSDVYTDDSDKPDYHKLKEHLVAEGLLTEECALKIIDGTTALLRTEGTMLDIEAPLTGLFL